MAFVYHGMLSEMVGELIYPLNQLAATAPEAYQLQKSKYLGREAVLDARISQTGLLFNDTVHCAPLHPHRLFAARDAHGFNPPRVSRGGGFFSGLFFEIPLERISVHPVLWYRWETLWINGAPGEDVPDAPPLEEFEPFDSGCYRELADVTDAHQTYLRRMKDQGKRPLLFVHIPHVLVAGPIDTRGLRIVRWDERLQTG
jgi:hypothetical protein